jgi:hypothetical protein
MENVSFKLIDVKYRQKTEKLMDAIIITGDITNNTNNNITIDLPTVTKAKRARPASYWNIGSYSGGILKPGITEKISFIYPSSELSQLNTGDEIMFEYSNGIEDAEFTYKVNQASSGGCYIVTYCYGRESKEYDRMIAFRDNVLTHCFFGRVITAWYYRLSPILIKKWPNSKVIKFFLKMIIRIFFIVLLPKTRCVPKGHYYIAD